MAIYRLEEIEQPTVKKVQITCCERCDFKNMDNWAVRVHVVNEHLNFRVATGGFYFFPNFDDASDWVILRHGEPLEWAGPGWYGLHEYRDCQNESFQEYLPVTTIRDMQVRKIAEHTRIVEMIDAIGAIDTLNNDEV